MKHIKLFLFFVCILVAGMLSAQIMRIEATDYTGWIEYSANPVFNPVQKAYYPSVIYDANQFSGHGDSYYYKMWYSTANGIRLAYSDDGVNWIAQDGELSNLATPNHPWVLYDQDGFGEGVHYKIWYWSGISNVATIASIRYAESLDGITWTSDQVITQDATQKLVDGTSGDWWYHLYGPACLLYDKDAPNTGTTPFDYKYVMYFDACSEGFAPEPGVEALGLAYSSDGKHWTRYGILPVVMPGPEEWDDGYVTRGTVLKFPDGTYGLWYSGGRVDSNDGIGFASSTDGVTWVKDANNPIFHEDDTGYLGEPWRSKRTYTPIVIYDGNMFSGHGDSAYHKMWYSGKDSTTSDYAIGYANLPAPPPVGGVWVPINKTELLAPWIGLASLITVAAVSVVYVKRRKKRQN